MNFRQEQKPPSENTELKPIHITGMAWLSHGSSNSRVSVIGVVTINNGFGEKAYIGAPAIIPGFTSDEKIDAIHIAKNGGRFPLDLAKHLIMRSGTKCEIYY